ncbi:MAG: alpha/beta hydrolase [Pseudomonadota bacterium]
MARMKILGGIAVVLAAVVGGGLYALDLSSQQSAAALSLTEPADRFVEVEGLSVRVREQGPANAPVLLMLHGFTFSLESFDALADQLSDRYRIVSYDLRGHGLTGADPEKRYAPDQRAEHIGSVMKALDIDRATIVGNSLGGLAAWRFAANNPGAVDSLVLISPGAYPINGVTDEPADVPPALEAYFRFLPDVGIDASIARIFADPDAVSDERRASIKAMMRAPGNSGAFIDSVRVFTLPDPEPDLARIEAPTLIIWGADDVIIAPTDGVRMKSVMRDAELVTLDGVGHVAHEETPERVAEEIHGFLIRPRDES